MRHHKYLKNKELHKDDIGFNVVQICVTFNRNTTQYFESKCKFYFRTLDGQRNRIVAYDEESNPYHISLESILSSLNVRFRITYNSKGKLISTVSVKIVNEDKEHPFMI